MLVKLDVSTRSDLTRRAERETSKAKLIFSNAQLERISKRTTPVQFEDPWPVRSQSVLGKEPPPKPIRTHSMSQRSQNLPISAVDHRTPSYHTMSFDENSSVEKLAATYTKSLPRPNTSREWLLTNSKTTGSISQQLSLQVVSTNYYSTDTEDFRSQSQMQFNPSLKLANARQSSSSSGFLANKHPFNLRSEETLQMGFAKRGNARISNPEEHEMFSSPNSSASFADGYFSTVYCDNSHSLSLPPSSYFIGAANPKLPSSFTVLPHWVRVE